MSYLMKSRDMEQVRKIIPRVKTMIKERLLREARNELGELFNILLNCKEVSDGQ